VASPRASLLFVAASAATLVAATATTAAAVSLRGASAPDQIVLSGSVVVPRGAEVGEVVVVRGSARIQGVADGDVVVGVGPVVVTGQVAGDVLALDGRVTLGQGAQVGGDVSARGAVALSAGAAVAGTVRQHVAFAWRTPIDAIGRFASWLAVSVSTLLLGLLLVMLVPRALDAVATVSRAAVWPSAGWGLALAIGVPALIVLGMASLVALPLGLVVLLGCALLLFAGYALAAFALGRAIWAPPWNRAFAFLLGWAILRAIAAIPFVSGITFALASLFGLGAGLVATWRARDARGRHRGRRRAPAPLATPIREEAGL